MPNITDTVNWFYEQLNDPHVGYSQDFRAGQTLTKSGAGGVFQYSQNYLLDFTGERENATLKYYDCSAAVFYGLEAGGWDVWSTDYSYNLPWTTTNNEISCLKKLGFYEWTGKHLQAGDVAWKYGHTALVVSECDSNYVHVIEAHGRGKYNSDYIAWDEQWRDVWRSDFTNFYRSDDGGSYEPIEINLYMVAAIAGNFVEESQVNPGLWESLVQCSWTTVHYKDDRGYGCGGYGLGQWTNTDGNPYGRLYQFYDWMSGKGFSPSAGDGQVQYIFVEKVWNLDSTLGKEYNYGFTSFDDYINTDITDLEILVHAWNACWEGIKNDSWDARVEHAKDAYDYISEHKDDEDITNWISGNRYLTLEEIHNNEVMLYRALYNQFNDFGYSTNNGGGSIGDSGNPNTTTDTSITFGDVLYSMLGNKNNSKIFDIHIIDKPKGK